MNEIIKVYGNKINTIKVLGEDYISLTDIAREKNEEFPADVIKNWMRTKSTIKFLGLWERINNDNFKLVEFDQFKNKAGENSFVLTPKKWIDTTNAIGIISKSGRYSSGTFVHKDIAFEFASWVSEEFKLYLIKEFQRLKEVEERRLDPKWTVNRILSKVNYQIHTDSIKKNLIEGNIQKFDDWWKSISNTARLKENIDYEIKNDMFIEQVVNKGNLTISENPEILKKTKFRGTIPLKNKDYILTLRAGEYCAVLTKGDSGDLYRK